MIKGTNFNTVAEMQQHAKSAVSVLSTAINRWIDMAGNLTVSTSDSRKMNILNNRVDEFINSISSGDFHKVIDFLESDKILECTGNLKSFSNNDISYYFKGNKNQAIHKFKSLKDYGINRDKRLKFLQNSDGLYKIKNVQDIRKMLGSIDYSIQSAGYRELCPYLANEAAAITRNLNSMSDFAEKSSLVEYGQQIVRDAVFAQKKF